LIECAWGEGTADAAASLLEKPTPPHLAILKQLISGEIDADRTDYLLRDAHHCGVDYGRFDHRRLLECLEVIFDEAEIPEVALAESGLQTYEALILARFQMNVQVYHHRVRRIYDYYLKRFFESLPRKSFETPSAILRENDFTMLARIEEHGQDREKPGHVWAKRILDRRHHVEVFAAGPLEWNVAAKTQQEKFKRRFEQLQQRCPKADLILDLCEENKPVSLHKLVQPDDRRAEETAPERMMKLIRRGGGAEPLGLASLVLGKVSRDYTLPRIFADLADCEFGRKPMTDLNLEEIDKVNQARAKLRMSVQKKARAIYEGD
jgi:HD superfamily phosphohydrolase